MKRVSVLLVLLFATAFAQYFPPSGGSGGSAASFGANYTVGSVAGISACTHVGFTGATFSQLANNAINFQTTNNAGSFNIEYCSIPAPSTPYKITMQLLQTPNRLTSNAFAGAGLAWSDGTKFTTFRFDQSCCDLITVQMTNATTGSANQTVTVVATGGFVPQSALGQYLQIIDDGTNRTTCYSLDGVNYKQFDQVTRTTFLTPTTIGPFITNSGMIILSWTQSAGTSCG